MIVEDEEEELRERRFPRFIASTKDCSCIISFAPGSPQITAESQSALYIASFRSTSSVSRESPLQVVGGRKGFGREIVCRHPYPVISVVRVFSFESEGYVCTLLVTTSDEKEERAVQRMSRRAEAIEEIARSIRIKKEANTAVDPTPRDAHGNSGEPSKD